MSSCPGTAMLVRVRVHLAAALVALLSVPCATQASEPIHLYGEPSLDLLEGELAAETLPSDPAGMRGIASGSSVRAVVRSIEAAAISADLNARITYLPRREGDRITKGEPIVKLDCRRTEAELAAAEASYQRLSLAYATEQKLESYAATGSFTVAEARYDMLKAEADRRVLEAKQSGCTILAPFDGIVTEKVVQVHEMAEPSQPILRIVNSASMELVMMVPSSWLPRMKPGSPFMLHVDELDRSFRARVVQSTGLVDPVSQSGRLIGELTEPAPSVLHGMSGTAVFDMEAVGQ